MTDKELKTPDRFDVFSPPPDLPVQERMKEIRLSGPLSNTEIPEGHYYSLDFNVPQGDRAIEKDLGEEITVNILRDSMRLRKWNDMEKRYDYTSTEFHNFQASVVVLYNQDRIPTQIVAALPYSHRDPKLPMMGGKGPKSIKEKLDLKVSHIMYFLYEEEVYRMSFNSTDAAGLDENDQPLSFGEESEDSFRGCKKLCRERKMSDKMFLLEIGLGSQKKGKKIMRKTFKVLKDVPKAKQDQIFDHLSKLYAMLSEQMWTKYTKARENTPDGNLDSWSLKVLENIDKLSIEPLLYSRMKEVKVDAGDVKEIIEVSALGEGDVQFPPSDEELSDHRKKLDEVSNSLPTVD